MSAAKTAIVGRISIYRGWVIAVAVIAIALGLIAFLVPRATLLSVAIIFGIFFIASGAFRLVTAFAGTGLPGWVRWFSGLLGGLTLVTGILCLANPWDSLAVLGIVIGLGWVFGGASSITKERAATISSAGFR